MSTQLLGKILEKVLKQLKACLAQPLKHDVLGGASFLCRLFSVDDDVICYTSLCSCVCYISIQFSSTLALNLYWISSVRIRVIILIVVYLLHF